MNTWHTPDSSGLPADLLERAKHAVLELLLTDDEDSE